MAYLIFLHSPLYHLFLEFVKTELYVSSSFTTVFPNLYEEYNFQFKVEDDIKRDKMDFSQKHILSNKNRGEHLNILKLYG